MHNPPGYARVHAKVCMRCENHAKSFAQEFMQELCKSSCEEFCKGVHARVMQEFMQELDMDLARAQGCGGRNRSAHSASRLSEDWMVG